MEKTEETASESDGGKSNLNFRVEFRLTKQSQTTGLK